MDTFVSNITFSSDTSYFSLTPYDEATDKVKLYAGASEKVILNFLSPVLPLFFFLFLFVLFSSVSPFVLSFSSLFFLFFQSCLLESMIDLFLLSVSCPSLFSHSVVLSFALTSLFPVYFSYSLQ